MSDNQSSDSNEPIENEPFRGIVLDDVDGPVETICRYLNSAQPARLLVNSFIALATVAILAIVGSKFAQDGIAPYVLSVFMFFFGTVGALLPVWAVARLIADAIKDGAKE
ncbi:hypothetical protein COB72_11105 [bacterium]|nr:MAG: hypothetical protein COB72_11105 [bacterium]